jgi:tRNA dimethylallyltransferase
MISSFVNLLSLGQIFMMNPTEPYRIITITGPTASGKTRLAAGFAAIASGEIISADSRQVYRRMDLGTGKDYDDYLVNGIRIPFHLIDIAEPGSKYNVFEFQQACFNAIRDIISRDKLPVLCGGTGMYIESVLKGYKLVQVPVNPLLREKLDSVSDPDLEKMLASMRNLHNISDTGSRKRLIRAIEIATYYEENSEKTGLLPKVESIIFGVHIDRETRRKRITDRLEARLNSGMIEEVKSLLGEGISPDDLIFYGLEYKFLTLFLTGQLPFTEMKDQLNTAIHQFAKRQMTWFRKMEREGTRIHWIDGHLPVEKQLEKIFSVIE